MDPQPESEPTLFPEPEMPKPGKSRAMRVIGISAAVLTYIGMFIVGGEFRKAALVGTEVIPFAILAMLAYAASSRNRKVLAIVYWSFLICGIGLVAILMTFAADLPKLQPFLPSNPANGGTAIPRDLFVSILKHAALAVAGVCLSAVIGIGCFFARVRGYFARLLNIDAESFVHTTALATAVASTLILMIPLLTVHEPPLLILLKTSSISKMDFGLDIQSMVYVLLWIIPATLVGVGYLQTRTLDEARIRLGLVWPNRRQMVLAVLILPVLLAFSYVLDIGITGIWHWLHWPQTDSETVELLFGFASRPVGAFIASYAAGFGEEIAFRGVLQPRLGIVLPALMFASVHAFQYNFDALLPVLCLGLIFGVIRKYGNTTMCALLHGSFDFVLFMGMYLSGRGH